MNREAARTSTLTEAVERLASNSHGWGPERLIDEGLDVIRDHCWASGSALYSVRNGAIEVVRERPLSERGSATSLSPDWFPWGLAPVSPQRFMFIEDASRLPLAPNSERTLGDLGICSCVHLPILERQRAIGFLHVMWPEPRLVWNDETGRLLRNLGRLLIARSVTVRVSGG